MTYDTIAYAVEDGLALITLNRPDAMNAYTPQMCADLIAAFDAADADPAVGAVVVTGAGRAFCAGADLSAGAAAFSMVSDAMKDGSFDDSDPKWRDTGGLLNLRIFESHKPVVGAINGSAVGIGATMILPMDARIAAEGAKFAYPFTKRGIAWDGCASWFLPRVVGVETALDWGLTGRTFMAGEALEKGLVSQLLPAGKVLEAAKAKARSFLKDTAPVSVAMNRALVWRMLGAAHPMEAHRIESRAIVHRGMSEDAKEGVMSFLEKRPPDFPARAPDDYPPGWPWREEPGYEE
ncbi:MAG: enoyl-CoA hydratase-related protein [Pseudomonadota bacterium]